jgi:hypothetical protein
MTYELSIALSFSILIAGIIAIMKYSRIGRLYYPFIYLVWLGCVNELLSYFLIKYQHSNIINATIYDLCESLLYLWFFKNLGVFDRRKSVLHCLTGLYIFLWIAESFYRNNFGTTFNSYFSIVYSFSIVLLSITAINQILFKEKEILKNPSFLICIGIVVFFIYKLVIEVFWLYGLNESVKFQNDVYVILLYVNFLCNLIFALAIIWMRKKQPFTLQF